MKKFIISCQIFLSILFSTICQGQKLLEFTNNPKANELFRNSLKEQQDGYFIKADSLEKEALKQDSNFAIALIYYRFPTDSIEREKRLEKIESSYSHLTHDQILFANLNMPNTVKDTVLSIINQLIHSYPKDDYLLTQLYYRAMQHEDYDLVKKILNTILAHNEYFPPAYNLYGYFFIRKEDYKNAFKYFKKYLELAAALPNSYDSNGDYYMAVSEYDKAVEYFEKAYSMDPENFEESKEKAEKAKATLKIKKWQARNRADSEFEALTALSCEKEKDLKSLNSDVPAFFRIKNNTPSNITVYWINYSGQRDMSKKQITVVPAGKFIDLDTYLTHPFIIIGSNEKCYGIYKAVSTPSIAVIKD